MLNPVIALTLTDFVMFPDQAVVFSHYRLLEKQTLVQYSGDLELVFIELPKFTKTLGELDTISEKWVYFVKNAGDLNYVPDTFNTEPRILDAFGIANQAGLTEDELEAQEKRHDFIRLQRGSIEKAIHDGETIGIAKGMEKGIAKGLEEGLEKGKAEGARNKSLDIARNLLDVLDDVTIAQKTGLSITDVRALR